MTFNNNSMGEGYVPAYQISATPFVTSSSVPLGTTRVISFNAVTKFFTVKNTSPTSTNVLAVGFTENGLKPVNANYFTLSGSESFSADLRVTSLFLSGAVGSPTFTLIAGLTGIPMKMQLTVTGSNGYLGVG